MCSYHISQGQNFGKTVTLSLAAGETFALEVPEQFVPGVYFVQLNYDDGNTTWSKIVISE